MRRGFGVLHVVRLVDHDEVETCLALREKVEEVWASEKSERADRLHRGMQEVGVSDDLECAVPVEDLELLVEAF